MVMDSRDLRRFPFFGASLIFISMGLVVSLGIHMVRHVIASQYSWSIEDLLMSLVGFAIGGMIGWLIIKKCYVKADFRKY